jgi:hypothetical protein
METAASAGFQPEETFGIVKVNANGVAGTSFTFINFAASVMAHETGHCMVSSYRFMDRALAAVVLHKRVYP